MSSPAPSDQPRLIDQWDPYDDRCQQQSEITGADKLGPGDNSHHVSAVFRLPYTGEFKAFVLLPKNSAVQPVLLALQLLLFPPHHSSPLGSSSLSLESKGS